MELHPSPRVAGADEAVDVCLRYLDRLPLAPEQRAAMPAFGDGAGSGDGLRTRMLLLQRTLAGRDVDPDNPTLASIPRRLELADAATGAAHPAPLAQDALGRDRLVTAPPLARASMVPRAWPRGLLSRWFLRFSRRDESDQATSGPRASAGAARQHADER
ncbi:MAG: hypothetical protein ACREX7_04485, partial [Casimicrobiaceae bacterium]